MNIKTRLAALERRLAPKQRMTVVFMDYRRTADGTVAAVCVNGGISV
jgi:hypothetical protein